MEEPKLSYHDTCKKNMHDTVAKYVRTSPPVYTGMGFYQLYGHFRSVFLREMPIFAIYVYEENAGIHIIQVDVWANPMRYLFFIPFEDIKKIHFFLPNAIIFTRIIIKTYAKKYVLGIGKNNNYRKKDSFGNSGYQAFMDKMRVCKNT